MRRLAPLGVELPDVLDGDAGRASRAGQAELLVVLGVGGLVADQEDEERGGLAGKGVLGVAVAALVLVVADEVVAELQYLYEVVDVRGCLARVLEQRQRARLARPLRAHEARAAAQLQLQPADGVARPALLALALVQLLEDWNDTTSLPFRPTETFSTIYRN